MKLQKILITPGIAFGLLCLQSTLPAETPPADMPPKFGVEAPAKDGLDKPNRRGEGKGRGMNIDDRITKLKTALELTPEQETKVRGIFETERAKNQAERKANKGNPPDKEARQQKMKETREHIHQQINEVLTPEQQKKFAALKTEMQSRNGKNGKGSKPDDKPVAPAE